MLSPNDYQVFKVSKLGHTVFELSEETQAEVRSELFAILKSLPLGGRLVIDFRDVLHFSPTLMFRFTKEFISESNQRGEGLVKGRFIAAKDMHPDLRFAVESILNQIHGSLYVFCNDAEDKIVVNEEVLNLPDHLKETLSRIKEKGPISSADLSQYLGSKKDSAREYVRKLYRRGLLKRTAVGTEQGALHWVYEAFTMRSAVGDS